MGKRGPKEENLLAITAPNGEKGTKRRKFIRQLQHQKEQQ
jgi:hypothetical protein